jgi:molecular chaperone DnaK (HSP70)
MDMIHAIPDWMALPELGTPINRNILEKAIHAGRSPIQMKALLGLIYNDLAFTFYNRVEAGKIALSNDGATIITLEDKDIALWELYTRHQFETDIYHYLVDVEKVLMETISQSGLEIEQIDAVVKTGGSSSIPLFTGMLERIFGREKVKQSSSFTSVVAGLAIKARGAHS